MFISKLLRVTAFSVPALAGLLVLSLAAVNDAPPAKAGTPNVVGQEAAELPRIVFDNFEPGIRAQVRKVYEAARQRPRDAQAVGRLGMVLQAYEDYEAAAQCYARAHQTAPQEFQWLYLLAIAQAETGRHAEARETLRAALRVNADYVPAQLKLADTFLTIGDWRASQQLYEAVARTQAQLAQAHYGLGRVKAAQRDFTAAVAHYRQAIERSPLYGAAHYGLALAYRALGQTEAAAQSLALYQKYRLIRPTTPDPVLQAVAALNQGAAEQLRQGVELEAAGRLAEAIAAHERALAINPQFEQVRLNLITLYARNKQPEQAAAQYRELQAINPNLAESHYNFGVLLMEQQQFAPAAQAFARALAINPQFAEAHLNYGSLLEQQQRYDEALQHYQLAVAYRPNSRPAHFQLARLLIYKNDLPAAIKHLHQTLAPEDEETPRYLYALASAYVRAGDKANALKYARTSRDRATALQQTALLALIERDLQKLEQQR
jgi:tetratricopeptide (TPR) repeat protein